MISLAFGVPGSGKSTLLHDLVRLSPGSRHFIVDHANEWGPGSPIWRGVLPSRLVIVDPQDDPDFWDPGAYVFQGADALAVAELAIAVGDTVFVDDELDKAGRKAGFEKGPIEEIVNRGRHLEAGDGRISQVHLLGACRRPQKLHCDVTELADQFFIFRCEGSRTLGRLMDDSLIEEGDWEVIRALPDFIFWNVRDREFYEIPAVG